MLRYMKGNEAAWEAGKVAMFVDFTLVTIKRRRKIETFCGQAQCSGVREWASSKGIWEDRGK